MEIVIADRMENEVVEEIKKLGNVSITPADLNAALAGADVLIVRSATKVTPSLLSSAPKLKIVARAGVGLDNVDAEACKAKGIKVVNTPGASSNAVAELVFALMFSLCRKIPKADAGMKGGKWLKKELTGSELSGKAIGIVGLGRIGSLVAIKARALGMEVLFYDPKPQQSAYGKSMGLSELVASADFITLHVPLLPSTQNLFNSGLISRMKKGAFLINTARGGLVDEDALFGALKEGKIAGAALDVYPQEPYSGKLCGLENMVLTPHIAGSTAEAQMRIGLELVEILREELSGKR